MAVALIPTTLANYAGAGHSGQVVTDAPCANCRMGCHPERLWIYPPPQAGRKGV